MTRKITKFFVLFSFLLAACSTGEPAPPTSQPEVETPVPATPTDFPTEIPAQFSDELSKMDGAEIKFWYVWNQTDQDPYQSAVTGFNNTNPYGITVQAVNQTSLSQNDLAIVTSLGKEGLPNIAMGTQSQYLTWERIGEPIVDLTPYIGDVEVGINLNDIQPVLWQQDIVKGKHYGVPAERYANVIFYNHTWAQELGFSAPPTTIEEFKQQACAGRWLIDQDPGTFLSWVYALGGEVLTESGYALNTPEIQDLLEYIIDLKNEECAKRPLNPFPNDSFANREALFYSGSTRGLAVIQAAFDEVGNDDEWVPIPFPGYSQQAVSVSGTSYIMLAGEGEEQLAAWIFIKYLLSPEVNADLAAASGALPVNLSALGDWQAKLLTFARNEPQQRSWVRVRPVLNDAVAQLFDFNFTPEDIPGILEEMQAIADELAETVGDN